MLLFWSTYLFGMCLERMNFGRRMWESGTRAGTAMLRLEGFQESS